ncbi:MAG: DUF3048 domain-containing protein [Oscillospiraceae bacterium]
MEKTIIKRALSGILCVAFIGTAFASCGKGKIDQVSTEPTSVPTTESAVKNINPLTGLDDLSSSAVNKRPVAVMVENSPSARPQWGLCSPDIVVEGVVEGGITRMMWLFSDISKAPKIGPTRSARHDYVEVAEGLDAIYVHFGGSNLAYDKIKADKVDDIDGMVLGSYFARDSSRNVSSEHTAYTTGENIVKAIASKKYRTEVKETYKAPFKFSPELKVLTGGTCNQITAEFSNNYKHTFKYNAEDKLYYNYMNTAEMKDANGKTMAVSNVVILYTNVKSVGDSAGHMDWDLKGGKGYYASNGKFEKITWSKGGASERLVIMASDGNELQFNTGKMWIGFVPDLNTTSEIG